MSICSIHRIPKEDCAACRATTWDIYPDWSEKHAEAEAAGTTVCRGCGFTYYRTVDTCPLCGGGRLNMDGTVQQHELGEIVALREKASQANKQADALATAVAKRLKEGRGHEGGMFIPQVTDKGALIIARA